MRTYIVVHYICPNDTEKNFQLSKNERKRLLKWIDKKIRGLLNEK